MSFIAGFFRFWYDFIVGDAWEIAAGIVVTLAIAAALVYRAVLPATFVPPLAAVGFVLVVGGSLYAEARRRLSA